MYVEGGLGGGSGVRAGAARALGVGRRRRGPDADGGASLRGSQGPVAHLDLVSQRAPRTRRPGAISGILDDVRAVFVESASVGAGVLPRPRAVVRIVVRTDGARQIDVAAQSLDAWSGGQMEPVTLVLDSATARAVCRVVLAGRELASASAEGGRAAQRALVLVDEVLARAGCEARDVGQIVVGCGPGSFTGLRIGIARARGLALALAVPCGGARPWQRSRQARKGAVALIDARRASCSR